MEFTPKRMINILICLDVDGTIETGQPNGPVTIKKLEDLEAEGCIIVIVSPSPNIPRRKNGVWRFPIFADKSRAENLQDAVAYLHKQGLDPIFKIYVSDNGDWHEAEKAKFIYCDAKMFMI